MDRFKIKTLTNSAKAMVILIVAFCIYWLSDFLHFFPDPTGANGYFYLKQTESLANGVGFYFKDRSLAFGLLVVLYKLIGSSLEAFRIGCILVSSLIVLASSSLYWRLTNDFEPKLRAFGLVMTAAMIAATIQLYEFELTFFKNAFALMLITWSLVFFFGEGRRSKWIAFAFMAAALLSHKSMLLILAAFLAPVYLNTAVLKRLSLRKVVAGIAALILVAVVFLWQFEKSATYLRALLNVFTTPDGWFRWASSLQWTNKEMLFAVIATFLTLVASVLLIRKVTLKYRAFFIGVILISIVGLNPFQLPGATGPGYRILILTPVFAWVALGYFMTRNVRSLWFAPIALLILSQPLLGTRHLDELIKPWFMMKDDVMKIKEFVTQDDHLTSHHGMEFFIDYETNIRSRSFLNTDPKKKEYRVAYVGLSWLKDVELQQELRDQSIMQVGADYILVTEAKWREMVEEYELPPHWKNPNIYRPDFIYE